LTGTKSGQWAVGQEKRAPILSKMTPVEYEVAAEAVDKELLVA
jgi:hypothetical protein